MGKKDIIKHQWKKGQSGNPNGRPKKVFSTVLDSLKKKGYEKVSKSQVRDAYEYLVGIDEKQLKAIVTDIETPMLFRVVGKEILSKKGFEIIEKMLDRAHGKAAQTTNLGNAGEDAFKVILVHASKSGNDTND